METPESGLDSAAGYNQSMRKRLIIILSTPIVLILLLIAGAYVDSWFQDYKESRNQFTVNDVCKLKKGMHILTAWEILGRPLEYQNYNFSNVYSAQYRNRSSGLFVEIQYTTDEKSTVTEIYWGKGRMQTLVESGICPE